MKNEKKIGTEVELIYMKKWHFGIVLDLHSEEISSSDDEVLIDSIPLSRIKDKWQESGIVKVEHDISNQSEQDISNRFDEDLSSFLEDTDDTLCDPNFKGTCQMKKCLSEGTKT